MIVLPTQVLMNKLVLTVSQPIRGLESQDRLKSRRSDPAPSPCRASYSGNGRCQLHLLLQPNWHRAAGRADHHAIRAAVVEHAIDGAIGTIIGSAGAFSGIR